MTGSANDRAGQGCAFDPTTGVQGGVDRRGQRLPAGFRIRLAPTTRRLGPELLAGGSPRRYLRLAAAGVDALTELEATGVRDPRTGALARRLTDAGLANPMVAPTTADATIVIPVRDRPDCLDEALRALGGAYPVVVVDDASVDPAAVSAVCAQHDAALLRRSSNGGPGPARNSGWRRVQTDLVAFVDSDVRAPPGWVEALAGHFNDPTVAVVAPRVMSSAACARSRDPERRHASRASRGEQALTAAARYGTARSPIDLGKRPALVAPMTRVAYVPSATLLVRRAALAEVGGFEAALRYGEDVDLIWRLIAAGWRIRYDPAVVVRHQEPHGWTGLWQRRFLYGTSAAPLSERHPNDLAPLVVHPLPTAAVISCLAGHPLLAAAVYGATVWSLRRRLRSPPVPASEPWRLGASALWQTWMAVGRWGAQFALPALLAAGARGPTGRRLAAIALVVSPPLTDWARRPTSVPLDPLRFCAAWLADEAAYGLGVSYGCLRSRRWQALLPQIAGGDRTMSSLLRRLRTTGRHRDRGGTR